MWNLAVSLSICVTRHLYKKQQGRVAAVKTTRTSVTTNRINPNMIRLEMNGGKFMTPSCEQHRSYSAQKEPSKPGYGSFCLQTTHQISATLVILLIRAFLLKYHRGIHYCVLSRCLVEVKYFYGQNPCSYEITPRYEIGWSSLSTTSHVIILEVK